MLEMTNMYMTKFDRLPSKNEQLLMRKKGSWRIRRKKMYRQENPDDLLYGFGNKWIQLRHQVIFLMELSLINC
ncbi:hypothetical protein MtrunA17_Chr3g0114131 [Medicago truncatula]|uniref:Uncharacterized protein n=1 Tax=Medicago truncatula TaxID=3880 RepID=A0A396IZQ8_MEDTR|nr:hypothetical protein MtrunA17_Chr3g0114131 [Medicago truncatula]